MNKQTVGKINRFSTSEIAYLALIIAACVVGRLLFQFIPNVQPMTAIFLILTYQLGLTKGLIVNVSAVLITNLYLGMGIWTLSQILSFSVVIIGMAVLSNCSIFRKVFILQISYSILAGFIYGFIIALIDVQIYGMSNFWIYYSSGLYFDLLHAVGNGLFYLVLAPIFERLFLRFQVKKRSKQ